MNTFICQQLSFGESGLTQEEKVDNTAFEEEELLEVVPSLLDDFSEFGCTHEENVDIASEIIAVFLVAAAAVVVVVVVASFESLNNCTSFVDIPKSRAASFIRNSYHDHCWNTHLRLLP